MGSSPPFADEFCYQQICSRTPGDSRWRCLNYWLIALSQEGRDSSRLPYSYGPTFPRSAINCRQLWSSVRPTTPLILLFLAALQITLDTSPPQAGTVLDGAPGTGAEVDYQEGDQLGAHWSGFFDRESGVMFYEYAFGETCLDADDVRSQNVSACAADPDKTLPTESRRLLEATFGSRLTSLI